MSEYPVKITKTTESDYTMLQSLHYTKFARQDPISSRPLELTNWRQLFFFYVCPLIDDKLRHNIGKVAVESRA